MSHTDYMQVTGEDKLVDEINPHDPDWQRITIGNCGVYFHRLEKTITFHVSVDEAWPIEAASRFRRIMEYIEITYGR